MKRKSSGTFQVYDQLCNECLFGPNKIVSDSRRRDILQKCAKEDRHFICHKATIRGEEICCAAFYDSDPNRTNLMRIAGRLGVIERVPLPEEEDHDTGLDTESTD